MTFNVQRIDDSHAKSNYRYGTVVSLTGTKLVTSDAGREQAYALVSHSRVTQRGRTCRPGDVQIGARVRVTVPSEDDTVAIDIENLLSPGSVL